MTTTLSTFSEGARETGAAAARKAVGEAEAAGEAEGAGKAQGAREAEAAGKAEAAGEAARVREYLDFAGEGLDGQVRRQELAHFLRTRRERTQPEEVGVMAGGRRRTPGLRREEVAQLAGVGVTWYTWLEQGRAIRPSDQVLDAISRALRLDRHEREHLFTLAGSEKAVLARECDRVSPGLLLVLERLGDYPAAVLNARQDLLAYNRSYQGLLGDLDGLPFDERNLLWIIFCYPELRERLVDWEPSARLSTARFRVQMASHASEPSWRAFVKRLIAASPDFARIWGDHEVAGAETVLKRFAHAELGLLSFHGVSLACTERAGNRLSVYTPADEATAVRTAKLVSLSPPPLARCRTPTPAWLASGRTSPSAPPP